MVSNLNDIRHKGYNALFDALGPIDTIRFIQQMKGGQGDYTKERKKWLGNPTVDEIVEKKVDWD